MAFFLSLILQTLINSAQSSSIDVMESIVAAAAGNYIFLISEIAPGWVISLYVCGTIDIIRSSLVTLVACTYSAIYLNVPSLYEKIWPSYRRKAKWVLVTLLAPEILVFCAMV